MAKRTRSVASLLALLAILGGSAIVAYSVSGAVEGKVSDPKGAAVSGASITITAEDSPQKFTGVTDKEGHFKVEGLPAGVYTIVISAPGFSDARKEAVTVTENDTVSLNVRLEVAAIEASVNVITGAKANSDPIYQQLRTQGKTPQDFSGPFATVNNLVLEKEGAAFNLRSGEIYFLAPVEGRYSTAVFIGNGEFSLIPPTENEKNSLKLFTNEPSITEQFTSLTMRFTDKTFDVIKNSPAVTMGNAGPQVSHASSIFHDNQNLLRKELRDNFELRVLADLYAPERAGFFTAFINGKRFNKLVYLFNPLGIPEVSPEEVLLLSYGEEDGGYWTAFHRLDEYAKRTASSSEDHRLIDLTKHEIDGTIKGTRITAKDRLTFRALVSGRVIPLSLFGSLRVSSVQDEQGRELNFIQEAKDQDSDLGIIMPQSLEVGKNYTLTVKYDGSDALRDSGGGNFILIPRSTWYPNNGGTQFGDRAIFNITFHYPKSMTFVGTGAPTAPDTQDGDLNLAKWSSGTTELAVAGFNYGRFKKKAIVDSDTGYNVEFYANVEVPDELKEIQRQIESAEAAGIKTMTTLGSISTTTIADSAIGDAQNATRIYTAYFGKLPYTRIAMTQQPAGFFGQAWPTLVFMPYTAFMDSTQRTQLMGVRGGTNNFWRYVAPHEVAHQWWGHTVGWTSYRDQWMSEGFAEFSTSLYVFFVRKDMAKFTEFWENQRHLILDASPATKDRKPYKVGPVTQGYRLNSGKTGNVARFSIYPKGAYILHMIRMMMYDQRKGDEKFQAMMKDFIQTHFNKDVSTEDFKGIVEKHITPSMDLDHNGKMDWFFNEYVYGIEMPSYRLEYQVNSDNSISGKITQSDVSNNFAMLVPLYVDFGKGWVRLGAATLIGNSSVDIANLKLPAAPKKVAICALNDVLAASIQNGK